MRTAKPNTLADFPIEKFHVLAYCTCGRSQIVNEGLLPSDTPMQCDTWKRLRCSACGAREPRIIISYHKGIDHAARSHGMTTVQRSRQGRD